MDNQAWVQLACGAMIIAMIALACAWNSERKEKAYFERLAADLNGQLEKSATDLTHAETKANLLHNDGTMLAAKINRLNRFVESRHVTVMNKKTGRFGPFEPKDLDDVLNGKEIP